MSAEEHILLGQLDRHGEKQFLHRGNRTALIVMFVVLSLIALCGGLLSMCLSIVIFVFILPAAIKATAPENASPTEISYVRGPIKAGTSAKANLQSRAARYAQISEACKSLAKAEAFYLRDLSETAKVRRATDLRIDNFESGPWCIGNTRKMLYFFPEHVVVREEIEHALLPYNQLHVKSAQTTWNALPHNELILVSFISPQGTFFELLVSDKALADNFCTAVTAWAAS